MVTTHRPAWMRAGLCLLLSAGVVALASLDHMTGDALDLSMIYALIVIAMSWFVGLRAGLLAALTATSIHLQADAEMYVQRGIDATILVNEMQRAVLLLAVAWVANHERHRVELLARQRDDLAVAQQEIGATMEAARRVQKGLLAYDIPRDKRIDMSVRWATSMLLGGDFHALEQRGDRLYLCVADVSGKGPPAALVTGLLRGCLESLDRDQPAEVLTRLNRQLTPCLPPQMFVTCFYAVYCLQTRQLTHASAGHDPGLLRRGREVIDLDASGLPLGIEDDAAYRQQTIELAPDDVLLLYTDGLTTARTPDGRLGDDEVRATVRSHRGDSRELVARLFDLTPELARGTQEDDVVVVAMQVR